MTRPYGVILAGGAGTRFWPASRQRRPKQLLPLVDAGETLIQATTRRLRSLLPADRIFVVTSEALANATAEQLPELPREHILAEPLGRNTAACVGWAAAYLQRLDPEARLAVLPADPHIGDEDALHHVLRQALDAAVGNRLVTVGVQPTRPETGYGYVKLGKQLEPGVFQAERFVEKPALARAQEYLRDGSFLWNSGMFFFRASAVMDEIQRQLPPLARALSVFRDQPLDRAHALLRKAYPSLPRVSFDHGVMEGAAQVVVVRGSFGWVDIGSWMSAWELAPKDEQGNAATGHMIAVKSVDCYVQSPRDKLVALVGVRDLVVVDTEDALLVVPKENAQLVRAVVEALEARDDKRHL